MAQIKITNLADCWMLHQLFKEFETKGGNFGLEDAGRILAERLRLFGEEE